MLDHVLLLKYMYIFVIFESQFTVHNVKPGFVTFVLCAVFRMVTVNILSLCSVFYLCRRMSY